MEIIENVFIANPSHIKSASLLKIEWRLHLQSNDKYLQEGPVPLSFQNMNVKTVLCQLSGVGSTSTTSHCLLFYAFAPLKLPFLAYFTVCTHTDVCIYVHVHMYIQCIYIRWMCVCVHIWIYIYICVCMYVYAHVDMCMYVYMHISREPLFSISQGFMHSSRNLDLAGTVGGWHFLLS